MDQPITQKGSWLPLAFSTAVLFIIVIVNLTRYGNIKTQPWYISIVCIVGWFFPFWIVVLLPLDLASTIHDKLEGRLPFAYASQSFLFVAWRVIYWTSFCLTWTLIPMMQAYMNTGDFTISKRLKLALHTNLRFYSIYLFVGFFGLVYLIFGSGYTTREKIQSYVMAAANSWGLFLVVIFMGYGLVSVPRSLWYSGDFTRHLIQHYADATKLKEECIESEIEFSDVAKIIHAISKRENREIPYIRDCINTMVTRFPFTEDRLFSENGSQMNIPTEITEDYLVKVSKRMILAYRMRNRKHALWNNLLDHAFYLQDIIKNKDRATRQFYSTLRQQKEDDKWGQISATIEWWWVVRISPFLNRIIAILFSLISVFIIWSELTFNVRKPTLSIVSLALKSCGTNYAAVEIMAFFTLMYMCICVYSSLFKIRFFNLYLLIPNHHTDENSLLWFTGYMCKMMAPLCYNFINLAGDAPAEEAPATESVFSTFMGKADLFEFLGTFVDWFPVVILIPSFLLFFNIQDRFLSIFGIKGVYKNNDAEAGENEGLLGADYEEGKDLVFEERAAKEREINPDARTSSGRQSQSPPHMQVYLTKYKLNQSQRSRNDRNRKINELLEGSPITSQYHDNVTPPSTSTSSSPNEQVKLDTINTKTFSDKMKQTIGDLFNSLKSDSREPRSISLHQQSPTESELSRPAPSRSNGRVLGRPSTESNRRNSGFIENDSRNTLPFTRLDDTSDTESPK
ncbi:unnamed protein product [Rhizopus stolonifer]